MVSDLGLHGGRVVLALVMCAQVSDSASERRMSSAVARGNILTRAPGIPGLSHAQT